MDATSSQTVILNPTDHLDGHKGEAPNHSFASLSHFKEWLRINTGRNLKAFRNYPMA